MPIVHENLKSLGWSFLALFNAVTWVSGQEHPHATCTEESPCAFYKEGGVDWNNSSVILFDHGNLGGHQRSVGYLYAALNDLSMEHGFTLERRSNDYSNFTKSDLGDSSIKAIIYSSTDGNAGGAIPDSATRARVENFVQEKGGGLLLIHAACAFIDSWPFLQDACIQQYFHSNSSGTSATHYLENRTVDDEAHGLANPYTEFLLEGLNEREEMRNEWFTWRGNPRTTHHYGDERNSQVKNRIMLTALDEETFRSPIPTYPDNHYTAWTHTMGKGIVIHNSPGHDDIWRINAEQHGKELLWRELRYVAKDWGPKPKTKICTDTLAGNTDTDFDPETEQSDPATCMYCGDNSYVEYVAGKEENQYHNQYCHIVGIDIMGFQVNDFITTDKLNINITHKGKYNLQILKPNGELVFNVNGFGAEIYPNAVKEAGLYYVKLLAPGYKTNVKKLLVN